MRTSNKLLLGIIAGPLIILTLLHLTLYAKYKSGDYVTMKNVQREWYKRYPVGNNITHVSVYGVGNLRIIPADTGKLELENNKDSWIRYSMAGDSLVIHGDSVISRPGEASYKERASETVTIYLPAAATIRAVNTEINLYGSEEGAKARSYVFSLNDNTKFSIARSGVNEDNHIYFGNLFIDADHSPTIELTEESKIAELRLKVAVSEFTDNGASIEKVSIDADKISNITLKGDNLRKLNAAQ